MVGSRFQHLPTLNQNIRRSLGAIAAQVERVDFERPVSFYAAKLGEDPRVATFFGHWNLQFLWFRTGRPLLKRWAPRKVAFFNVCTHKPTDCEFHVSNMSASRLKSRRRDLSAEICICALLLSGFWYV